MNMPTATIAAAQAAAIAAAITAAIAAAMPTAAARVRGSSTLDEASPRIAAASDLCVLIAECANVMTCAESLPPSVPPSELLLSACRQQNCLGCLVLPPFFGWLGVLLLLLGRDLQEGAQLVEARAFVGEPVCNVVPRSILGLVICIVQLVEACAFVGESVCNVVLRSILGLVVRVVRR